MFGFIKFFFFLLIFSLIFLSFDIPVLWQHSFTCFLLLRGWKKKLSFSLKYFSQKSENKIGGASSPNVFVDDVDIKNVVKLMDKYEEEVMGSKEWSGLITTLFNRKHEASWLNHSVSTLNGRHHFFFMVQLLYFEGYMPILYHMIRFEFNDECFKDYIWSV